MSIKFVKGCTTGLKLTKLVAPHQCVCFLLFGFSFLCSGLKAVAVDPKDAKFLTYSKAMEKVPQSDFDDVNKIEEVKMLDSEEMGQKMRTKGRKQLKRRQARKGIRISTKPTCVKDVWKHRSQ